MSGHEWASRYETAISRFYEHLTRAENGTFRLDVDDGESIGIDRVVFADLKRSLDITNKLIVEGKLNPRDVEMRMP